MERLSERDRVLLGSAYRDPFGNLHHSPPPPQHHHNSDVDFADVFGGPPRRSSFYESRRSRADSLDSRSRSRTPFSGLAAEKPAFGELSSPARRRHLGGDFFDDIFPGSDSGSSPPRKVDRDPFSSTPDSRVLSPSRPVLVGGSSLPPQLSLPKMKLAKGVDHPASGSPTHHAPYKNEDGDSDASSVPYSPNTSRAVPAPDDLRNSGRAFYRQSPLSSQFSCGTIRSSEAFSKGSQSERYAASLEGYINGNQFHFSICKWAGKGVSLTLSSLSKETNDVSRYSRLPEVVIHAVDLPSDDDNMSTSTGVSNNQTENHDNKMLNEIFMESKHDAGSTVPKDVLLELDPKHLRRSTGNSDGGQRGVNDDVKVKKQDQKQNFAEHVNVVSPSVQDIPVSSEDKMHSSKVKGRVKEFIKIFNIEGSPKRKGIFESGDRMSKEKVKSKLENQVSVSAAKVDEEVKGIPPNNEGAFGIDSIEVNEILKMGRIPNFYMSSNVPRSKDSSSERNRPLGPTSDSTQESIMASVCNVEESHFEDLDGCLVEQLSQEQTENQQAGLHQDQIKIADAKIRDWSKGKEGNIRSLLSTLQYVLWSDSGWKPVPLVDIIEGTSVKRAYQKALLCLHPDKLQQRGAAEYQKYIAQKVFDILQEAWDQFNSVSSVF